MSAAENRQYEFTVKVETEDGCMISKFEHTRKTMKDTPWEIIANTFDHFVSGDREKERDDPYSTAAPEAKP